MSAISGKYAANFVRKAAAGSISFKGGRLTVDVGQNFAKPAVTSSNTASKLDKMA